MGRWLAVCAVFLTLAAPAPASAWDRYGRHPIYEFEREGFLIGFSAGFGSSHPCDECPGFGGTFMVGGMAQEDLAVVFELEGVSSQRDQRETGLGLATIGARYWPYYKVWLQGGVGVGVTLDDGDFDRPNPNDERDWAAMAGAGYDIVQRRNFAFDVSVRGAIAGSRKSVALTLGFNWY
jgi:hypothetical protein